MKRLLALLLLIILVAIPLRAEKWALLVGINNYPNDISSLKYCVADVEAFRQALVNVAGFKEDKVFLMTDDMTGQMEPTNINVIMRLGILAKQIQPEDTFVFYFSGHGIVNDGSSFLLAANSNTVTPDTLEMSAVPLDRVSKILSSVKAQQLLTVIDACRNNPETGRSGEDNVLTDDFSKGFKIRRSSSSGGQPSVSATLYACNVGERAYEWAEKGHGVFSYYLLEGLNGQAANSQGQVTVSDLAEYTQGKVVEWAQIYRNQKQTPWLSLQGGAKLVLAEGVGQVGNTASLRTGRRTTISINTEAEAWEVVKDSTNVLDIKDFLSVFPDGKLATAARLKIKRLEREGPTPKVTDSSSQQIEAELKKTQQRLREAERINQVFSRQKEAQLQEELRRSKAKEKLDRQRGSAYQTFTQEAKDREHEKMAHGFSTMRPKEVADILNEMLKRGDEGRADVLSVLRKTDGGTRMRILSVIARDDIKMATELTQTLMLPARQSPKIALSKALSKDRAGMVLIPAGPSTHAFYMDKFEVTNAQYRKFVQATGHQDAIYWDNDDFNQRNQPVVGVNWHDATAYAKWAGRRLPTEKEWEYAARGGLKGKRYLWGDQEPSSSKANYGRNVGKPTAVGSYPANGYGLYDMAGNVWEWCQDWYDSDQEYRVLRGGSWFDNTLHLRVAGRDNGSPSAGYRYCGFRCVSGSDYP